MQLATAETIAAIERSEVDYTEDRLLAMQEREGNPEGIELRRFGSALCLYSRTMPWPGFNTVKGLSSDDAGELDAILDFYAARGRKVQFELVPSRVDAPLLEALGDRGFIPSGHHTSMAGPPIEQPLQLPPGVVIRQAGAGDYDAYAAIHCAAFGLPASGIAPVAANNAVLHGRAGWSVWLAEVSGEPAAAAVLYEHGGVASLTFAGTMPAYRGRGLHGLLLRHRLNRAASSGCSLVAGQCAFLSASHRNMERAGLQVAYVRSTWMRRPER
ncbi:GNAT family N-acetyltransferase [Paenibacillus sabuli]|nr:GNAT family N-acetyltransferase [Paenibacillus sabuli]